MYYNNNKKLVLAWVSEWVSEWVNEWVNEWVTKFKSLVAVIPYGDKQLGYHWLRFGLAARRHQAVTWTNADLRTLAFTRQVS